MKGCTMTKYSALAGCSQVGVVAGRHVAPARVDLGHASGAGCVCSCIVHAFAPCCLSTLHAALHSHHTQERQKYDRKWDTIYKWTDWSEFGGEAKAVGCVCMSPALPLHPVACSSCCWEVPCFK